MRKNLFLLIKGKSQKKEIIMGFRQKKRQKLFLRILTLKEEKIMMKKKIVEYL